MDTQVKHWRSLQPSDIKTLHFILFAGNWPLPEFMLDLEASKTNLVECWAMSRQFEIKRLNRLKQTGWVVIADKQLWLTLAGLEAAHLWLEYSWAQTTKREIKSYFKRPVLKHRIPWGQQVDLWLRGDPIKTPLARWFDPALTTRG